MREDPSVMTRGLTGRGARGIVALYALTHIVFAMMSGHVLSGSLVEIGTLVVLIGATLLCVLPGSYPLNRVSSAIVSFAAILAALSVTVLLPGDGRWPGYSSWPTGATIYALIALSLRGRTRLAWATVAVVSAIILIWSVQSGQGLSYGVSLMIRQIALLAVGTAFSVAFERADRQLRRLAEARSRSAALQHAADVRASERVAEAARLVAIAEPAFGRIRAGTMSTDDVRREYLAIEAALRDALRARGLSVEPLVASARAARLRGVTVLLLDDAQSDLDPRAARNVATWVADILDPLDGGTVTARLTLADDAIAVSVVGEDAHRHPLDEHRAFPVDGTDSPLGDEPRRARVRTAESDASYAG